MRRPHPDLDWDDAPTPSLVIEVLSGATRRRDLGDKRKLYMDAGVPEYWIVDPEAKRVLVVRAGESDNRATGQLTWRATGARQSLVIAVSTVFG